MISDTQISEMKKRAQHIIEPWRAEANDLAAIRSDNRELIAEVERIKGNTGAGVIPALEAARELQARLTKTETELAGAKAECFELHRRLASSNQHCNGATRKAVK